MDGDRTKRGSDPHPKRGAVPSPAVRARVIRYLERRRGSRLAGGGFFARLLGRVVFLGGTPARLLRLGLLFLAGEFDHREHRGVAAAMTELDHARVAAAALFEARRDLVEELFYRLV